MFDAVSFPGGGNRCYWQGGFYETIAPRLGLRPRLRVGVSAGAFVACYTALGLGPKIRAAVVPGCNPSLRNFEWRNAWRGGRMFPVGQMYPDLIRIAFDDDQFAALQTVGDILIAIARPPRFLPVNMAAPIGIAAYEIEKRLFRPVHPASGRRLGFVEEFVSVGDLASADALVGALMASAAVPPFMPVGRIGGRAALDGGLVDNVPVSPLATIEQAGGRSLVLLTRRYETLPHVPGRIYVQPSQAIGVNQFSITDGEGIAAAYRLGVRDGEAFLSRLDQRGIGGAG